jgi:NADPH:quinone reductase-like Zn-dependent oxidoreductase
LRDKGRLKPGQRVLINGSSGGVGLFAAQLAHLMGAHVTAVCSEAAFPLVKSFGADELLDYKKTDFTQLGKKWDLIFDVSATRPFGTCSSALESGGTYVTTIAGMGDLIAPLFNPFRSRKARFIIVKGSYVDLDHVRSLIESGKLKVVVAKVFALTDAFAAQTFLETQKPKGKVILDVAA